MGLLSRTLYHSARSPEAAALGEPRLSWGQISFHSLPAKLRCIETRAENIMEFLEEQ